MNMSCSFSSWLLAFLDTAVNSQQKKSVKTDPDRFYSERVSGSSSCMRRVSWSASSGHTGTGGEGKPSPASDTACAQRIYLSASSQGELFDWTRSMVEGVRF